MDWKVELNIRMNLFIMFNTNIFKNLIYNSLGSFGAFNITSSLYRNSVLILCYHGGSLGDEWKFNPKLFMRNHKFSSRINYLVEENYNFIALEDLFLKNFKDIPKKSVCITFDDGWSSTFIELIPVLAEHGIPSTLYLHTNKFVQQMPIYNVAIGYLVFNAKKFDIISDDFLPWPHVAYNLRLKIDVDRLIFDMNCWVENNRATKEQVYSVLRNIGLALGVEADGAQFDDKRFEYISYEQIKKLASLNCSVELHGHNHRYPSGDPAAFHLDLLDCRNSILAAGLNNPRHYCYPSGKHDIGSSKVLYEKDVISATTCIPGFVNAKVLTNPHYLPRFLDGEDVSPIEFRAEISGVAEIFRKIRI